MKKFHFVFTMTLLAILSCSKSVEPPNVTTYSFTPGTVWNYVAKSSIYNFRPTKPSVTFRDTTLSWTAQAVASGDTLLNGGVMTSRVSATENLAGIHPSDNYYILRHDTLLLYAWTDGSLSVFTPKTSPSYRFLFENSSYNNSAELLRNADRQHLSGIRTTIDSLYYPLDPPRVLVFPLQLGLEWMYAPITETKKKVAGVESVATDGGSFLTYVIEYSGPLFGPAFVEKEYVGDHGLVKRSIAMKDLTISSDAYPEGFGIVDITLEYTLASIVHL